MKNFKIVIQFAAAVRETFFDIDVWKESTKLGNIGLLFFFGLNLWLHKLASIIQTVGRNIPSEGFFQLLIIDRF